MKARFFLFSGLLSLALSFPALVFSAEAPSVQWQDWSDKAFAQAKEQNKLILLDVNAAWCHWCHVMEDTTYKDPEIVALIEKHFVPIKVDVDARPDIAHRYGPIGWPATAFFTPDAQTIKEVGAYINPEDFLGIARGVIDSYAKGTWKNSAAAKKETAKPPKAGAIEKMNAWAEKELLRYYDPDLGGWGRRQKAPIADAAEHALWMAYKTKDPVWRKRALFSLKQERAVVDPVWGGVYQYSVGGGWDKPHFEKIMTVQAGALENYSQAYRAGGTDMYLAVARMMTDYFNGFLSSPEGGFYTSQDADVGAHDKTVRFVDGNDYYCLSDKERRKLGMPRIDTNVYARENGLAISAFLKMYAASQDDAVLKRALQAADLTVEQFGNGRGGFSHAAGQKDGLQYLADNAAFGKALVDCYEATGNARYLSRAKETASFMLKELASPDGFGFFANTADPKAVGDFAVRPRPFEENATAARFFLKLYGHTKDPVARKTAENTLLYLSDEAKLKDQGRFLGNYLMATEEFLNEPLHLLVMGPKDDPKAAALHKAALAYYAPYKILEWQDPKENPEITKTYPAFDYPVIYVCGTNRCSSPIADAGDLSAAIDDFLEASQPAQ